MTDDRSDFFAAGAKSAGDEKRRKLLRTLIRVGEGICSVALGYLFAGTGAPLGTYPFGMALAASMTGNAGFAAFGILLRFVLDGALRGEIFSYCAASVLICAARYVFSFLFLDGKNLFSSGRLTDGLLTRVLSAAIASIGIMLVSVISTGYDAYALAGGVFTLCASCALTVLLTALFDRRYSSSSAKEAGGAALMFAITMSLSGTFVFSVSPAMVFAFGATLWCGYCGGAARGCAAGFLLGLGCGDGFCAEFALAGLCSGLFYPVGSLAAASASLVSAICCSVFTSGTERALTMLPEALIASVAVTSLALLKIMPRFSVTEQSTAAALCRDITDKKREEESRMRMELLSKAMSSLGQIMNNLSQRMRRPDERSLENMCRAVWAENCIGCPIDCPCKNLSSVAQENTFGRLVSALMNAGRVEPSKLGDFARAKCPKGEQIIDEINQRASKMIEYAVKFDKTKIFAFDYEAMSQLMSDAVSQSGAGYTIDRILSDRLRRALLRAGLPAENIVVCGDRKKHVIATGSALATSTLGSDEIRGICESVCKTRFSRPEYTIQRGCAAMTLEGAKSFGTEYCGKQSEKTGERVCGDSVSIIESRDGYFYCFICDGMGSGPQAALTARVCRVFLEKMLYCGNDKTTTLEMLNMFLKNKGTECFATVDLLEIDLHLGTASFIKSGAAPSYILRDGSLFRIASGTLPIGILPDISAELTEFDLKTGDIIVMASDGVAGDFETEDGKNPSWLADFLTENRSGDLPSMAEKIMLAAKKSDRRSDDMTVELIRLLPPVGGAEANNEIPDDNDNDDDVITA